MRGASCEARGARRKGKAEAEVISAAPLMQPPDLERIARKALRELGVGDPPLTITADNLPDRWHLDIGGSAPTRLTVRAGDGTTANHIREQIFAQFNAR